MKTQTSGLLQPGYSRHLEKMISRSCGNLTHSHRSSTRPPCQRQQQPNPQKDTAGIIYLGPWLPSRLHHLLVSVVTMLQQDNISDQETHTEYTGAAGTQRP